MPRSKTWGQASPWARYSGALALEFPLVSTPILHCCGHEPTVVGMTGYVLAAVCGACLLWGRAMPARAVERTTSLERGEPSWPI
jgi:hypothetical protein